MQDRLEKVCRLRDEAHGIVGAGEAPAPPKPEVAEPDPKPPEDLEPVRLPRTVVTALSAQYTSLAREKKIEDVVTLDVDVETDDTPTVVGLVKSLDRDVDGRAAAVAGAMRFQPGDSRWTARKRASGTST